jgi:hypothetical protein
MKKILFAAAFVAATFAAQAQLDYGFWVKTQTQDEFGDLTGNYVTSYFSQGTFSNTATLGSELTARVVLWPDGDATIDLFEYTSSKAVICSRGCAGSISVKLPDGAEETYPVWSSSSGTILINSKKPKAKELITLLRNSTGEITILIRGVNFLQSYDRSSYRFKVQGMGGIEPEVTESDTTQSE